MDTIDVCHKNGNGKCVLHHPVFTSNCCTLLKCLPLQFFFPRSVSDAAGGRYHLCPAVFSAAPGKLRGRWRRREQREAPAFIFRVSKQQHQPSTHLTLNKLIVLCLFSCFISGHFAPTCFLLGLPQFCDSTYLNLFYWLNTIFLFSTLYLFLLWINIFHPNFCPTVNIFLNPKLPPAL